MAKTCKESNCIYPVFSKGYCKYHWAKEYSKPINKISQKRRSQSETYKAFIKSKPSQKRPKCIFCGKEISGRISNHHIFGRDGDNLNDTDNIVPAHNKCHVEEYHSMSVDMLIKRGWYLGFMLRIKKDYPKWYQKELYKLEKNNIKIPGIS